MIARPGKNFLGVTVSGADPWSAAWSAGDALVAWLSPLRTPRVRVHYSAWSPINVGFRIGMKSGGLFSLLGGFTEVCPTIDTFETGL
jgi:hypothetical protein